MKVLYTEEAPPRSHRRHLVKTDKLATQRAGRELLPLFMAALGRAGLSQAGAARELATVPQSAIQRWAGGECHLPAKYLATVADWVGRK
jgi:hypothetical protein